MHASVKISDLHQLFFGDVIFSRIRSWFRGIVSNVVFFLVLCAISEMFPETIEWILM